MSDERTTEQLIGDFARDFAAVVRGEIELNAVRRAPQRRVLLGDLAIVAAGGVALLLAAGAATVAAGIALSHFFSPAVAALVTAGGCTSVAALLFRRDRARRLVEAVVPTKNEQAVAAAEREQLQRLEALQRTARRTATALERDVIVHERAAALDALHRLGASARATAQGDVEAAIRALVALALAPARAGRELLR